MSFVNRQEEQIGRYHYSRAPWEKEVGKYQEYGIMEEEIGTARKEAEKMGLHHRWEKFLDFESMLPNERKWKLDTDKQGALRLEFSNQG